MKYATTYDATPAMFQNQAEKNQSLGEKARSYLAPVLATIIMGALLVGDLALRCYPYWS